LPLNNTSSFLKWPVQLIFFVLLQHQIILDYNSATSQLLDNSYNHSLRFYLIYFTAYCVKLPHSNFIYFNQFL
jgi:hypothetical protein